jgi:hypothetical protein
MHMHLPLALSQLITYYIHTKMIKREYQEVDREDDTDSLTPITRIKKEIIQDNNITISSANTTPKKKSKSKSTDGGEGPDTPKSKSPAKSVSQFHMYRSRERRTGKADDSDGPHPKMKSLSE